MDPSGKIGSPSAERYSLGYPPEISPDGRRFAFTITNARAIDELWVASVPQLTLRRVGSDPQADCDRPVWSPDGQRLAYARTARDGRDGIYVQAADGGPATRVLKPESPAVSYTSSAWLPDGSALVLTRQEAGRTRLALLPLGAGEADSSRLRPLLPSSFNESEARVSPDGRLIAYSSDESGQRHMFVAEFHADRSTGRPIEVRDVPAVFAFWSRDGKILYVGDSRDRYMKVAVRNTPELSLAPAVEQFDLQRLGLVGCVPTADGRFLAALSNEAQTEITRYDLVLGWSRMLAHRLRAARQ
jgi:Tol biopolymer transport system component